MRGEARFPLSDARDGLLEEALTLRGSEGDVNGRHTRSFRVFECAGERHAAAEQRPLCVDYDDLVVAAPVRGAVQGSRAGRTASSAAAELRRNARRL